MSAYAELCVTSNFSFLRGASHPEELVERAAELGLAAIGIADRNSFAGVVRAHVIAKTRGVRMLTGVRLVTMDGFEVVAYPTDREAYGRLCKLLTRGNRRAKKGECHLTLEDVIEFSEGQIFIALTPRPTAIATLAKAAPGRVWLGANFLYDDRAAKHLAETAALARTLKRAIGRAQRCAPACPRTADAAGRADLYPRKMHHHGGRQAAGGQCRAASESARRNGAPVPRLP